MGIEDSEPESDSNTEEDEVNISYLKDNTWEEIIIFNAHFHKYHTRTEPWQESFGSFYD